ncbi:MAG: hypothetical protein AB7O49_10025 [Sphingomonadales bacterium]
MSGQRHLRLAALVIAALGIMQLLWLVMDSLRAGWAPGWWFEAAFWGLLIVTGIRLMKGSDLAWFGAVVIYACATVVGVQTALDLALSSAAAEPVALAQASLLLGAGVYGLWVLLVSPRVKALRAAAFHRDRFALPVAVAIAVAAAAGVGWYLDHLSPAIQRSLGAQLGIAALFAVLVAWLASRNSKAPVRWEYLPLVVAGVAVVANLDAIGQLRELRPAAAALAAEPPADDADLAAMLPGEAFAMTAELEAVRRSALERLEAHTAALGPWPQMEALTPQRIGDPAAVDAASVALAEKSVAIHDAVSTYDVILEKFAEQRRRIVAPLSEPVRRQVTARLGQDEDAFRSHYGARVNLISRAAGDLSAMLRLLRAHRGRYQADWNGVVSFEDPAATEDFKARKASFEELVVWNARLRAEGADLAASRPAWSWVTAIR